MKVKRATKPTPNDAIIITEQVLKMIREIAMNKAMFDPSVLDSAWNRQVVEAIDTISVFITNMRDERNEK